MKYIIRTDKATFNRDAEFNYAAALLVDYLRNGAHIAVTFDDGSSAEFNPKVGDKAS